MMELGATICVRQKPMCLVCPVATMCAGYKSGEPEKLPRLQPKKIEQRSVTRAWCEIDGKILLKRGHAAAKRLAGLHELPEFADLGRSNPDKTSLLAVKRRAITRFQIVESIHQVRTSAPLLKKIREDQSLEWVALSELNQVTLSGPHKRWIEEIVAKRTTD
jgi:A/G-specific adenine glycosylase